MKKEDLTYSAIIPLIGGINLGMSKSLGGTLPEEVISYTPFGNNDSHYINHLNEVGWKGKYVFIDEEENKDFKPKQVDIVTTTCPCAGLSSLSTSSSSDSAVNDWMYTSAEYVLGTMKPKVFWGENAPRLATKMGEPVVKKLREVGEKHGYSFSIYKTKSLLHGLSQVRDRTFYFFWQNKHEEDYEIPLFKYIKREYKRIEDTIREACEFPDTDPMNVPINEGKPSDDPWYAFVRAKLGEGKSQSHQEFYKTYDTVNRNMYGVIEASKYSWPEVSEWMYENGYEKPGKKALYLQSKLDQGLGYMSKEMVLPYDHIGAFVGHFPYKLTHPDEDRFITYREALSIMSFPQNFNLVEASRKFSNHICQNVPVSTAADMGDNVIEALLKHLDTIPSRFVIQCNKARKLDHVESEAMQEQPLDAFF